MADNAPEISPPEMMCLVNSEISAIDKRFIGFALVEAQVLYALLVAFILIAK